MLNKGNVHNTVRMPMLKFLLGGIWGTKKQRRTQKSNRGG